MKEKRYFCDFWSGEVSKKEEILIILLSLIFITFMSIIGYKVIMHNYGYELNSYSTETYNHLNEIANNVIKNGVGIDLSEIPDDVIKYEITGEKDKIIFKYYLNNTNGMYLAPSANMTIELSNDFTIISKKSNYFSKEKYVKNIKHQINLYSLLIGSGIFIIAMIIISICCTIGSFISQSHKNQNLS